jgi:hypothetical protein
MNEQRKSGGGRQTPRTPTRRRSPGNRDQTNNTGNERSSERDREIEQRDDVDE